MVTYKKLLMILLLAGAGMQLAAMENPSRPNNISSEQKQQELNNRLLIAVVDNKYNDAKGLLERGADPEPTQALWHAAWAGNEEMCRLLLEHGADVKVLDIIGGRGETPLHRATRGNIAMVRFLIEHGADVNVRTRTLDGNTALMRSAMFGTEPAVILTTIPLRAKQDILARFEAAKRRVIAAELSLKQSGLVAPKDVRKMIGKLIFDQEIESIIEDQMHRIEQMLAMKNYDGKTARDLAFEFSRPDAAQLVDFNNPETRAWLRAEMEQKVREILFGDQKKRDVKQ